MMAFGEVRLRFALSWLRRSVVKLWQRLRFHRGQLLLSNDALLSIEDTDYGPRWRRS